MVKLIAILCSQRHVVLICMQRAGACHVCLCSHKSSLCLVLADLQPDYGAVSVHALNPSELDALSCGESIISGVQDVR